MKFINTSRFTKLAITLLLFVSCDPINYYQQVVTNQSQEEIVVSRYNKSTPSVSATLIDSTIITKNSQGVIFQHSGLGGFGSNGNCNFEIVDSIALYVHNKPLLRIIKKLNDSGNWTYSRGGNSREGYNSQCTAVITDSDIVPK